jgi:hypothetical protein
VAVALNFSFTAISFDVEQIDPTGAIGSHVQASFDLATNQGQPANTAPVTYSFHAQPGDELVTAFTPETEQTVVGSSGVSFGPASVTVPTFDASVLNSIGLVFGAQALPQVDVQLFNVAAGNDMTYDFQNVSTSSVAVSGLSSTMVFAGTRVQWTSRTVNPDGSLGTAVTAGFDLSTNKAF